MFFRIFFFLLGVPVVRKPQLYHTTPILIPLQVANGYLITRATITVKLQRRQEELL